MPVHQSHTVQWGTSQHVVFLFASRSDRGPAVGVRLAEATAAFATPGAPARSIPVTTDQSSGWKPGRLSEVDGELLPGVYEFAVPDEVLAPGAREAVLVIQAPDATFDPVKFDLVAYDPQDAWSLGLTQLQDYKRHQVLRQALPRFTEMELELGKEGERKLADRLGEAPPAWADTS